jgi:micrococcal nuclease
MKWLWLMAFILLLSCSPPVAVPPVVLPAVSPTTPPVTQPAILNTIQASNPITTEAKVTRVIDGDTIEVNINGKTSTVRYIGIDAPEMVDTRTPVQHLGKESLDKNRELADGKVVRLEKDISETDKYGRLLRYVYVGSLFINAELVRLGYASAISYPPDIKYQDKFLELQKLAREAKLGLWNPPATVPTAPATIYIGNKNTKKLHYPTCSSVEDMKESNKILFNSMADALAQGYQPCQICRPK